MNTAIIKKKSLKKYFKGLKVTFAGIKSFEETKQYLKSNGFSCYKKRVTHFSSNGRMRKGYINIAKQNRTGKTIAFEIDNNSPRDSSIQKLYGVVADYKIVLLKDEDQHYFRDDGIEVIGIDVKTDREIEAEKAAAYKKLQQQRISSASQFKSEDERTMYDLAYEYMEYVLEEYGQIPKRSGLYNRMGNKHPVLYAVLEEKGTIHNLLSQVHTEWQEILSTKRSMVV